MLVHEPDIQKSQRLLGSRRNVFSGITTTWKYLTKYGHETTQTHTHRHTHTDNHQITGVSFKMFIHSSPCSPLYSTLIHPQLSSQQSVFISAVNQIPHPGLKPTAFWRSETSLMSLIVPQQSLQLAEVCCTTLWEICCENETHHVTVLYSFSPRRHEQTKQTPV